MQSSHITSSTKSPPGVLETSAGGVTLVGARGNKTGIRYRWCILSIGCWKYIFSGLCPIASGYWHEFHMSYIGSKHLVTHPRWWISQCWGNRITSLRTSRTSSRSRTRSIQRCAQAASNGSRNSRRNSRNSFGSLLFRALHRGERGRGWWLCQNLDLLRFHHMRSPQASTGSLDWNSRVWCRCPCWSCNRLRTSNKRQFAIVFLKYIYPNITTICGNPYRSIDIYSI